MKQLSPLREVIAEHGLGARKSLGQHFLLDLNLTRKIAREVGDLSGKIVIEIGPGPGGLTRALLETEAKAVLAIEKDSRCLEALQMLVDSDKRLRVIEADAMQTDPVELTPKPRVVVANLPYNIGTALLVAWLQRAQEYDQFILMFQKEVAKRIAAKPRTPAYGRLSVLCQYCCDCEILFTVPARAFVPPPKVDSAVIRLVPKKGKFPVKISELERVTAQAFGQRRKMLRGIFKGHLTDEAFAKIGIKPQARAEELAVEDFIRLTKDLIQRPE
ncbi:MAG: 16S rRNA (adenine(1518)-N(6)/adenine(1519)-N(6))-dimethyltransferase RsmA [Proteobacteria bacterium]|nr:16S rRNA (adenine(1518)-N(6)/adenine(1519)-N(6))-dimethyltransferase RsmA [Pseudomonadota bacterium]